MMERSKVIRSLAFWASGAVLVVIGLFLYLKNPFDVPFNNLLLALLIWPIIFVIVDFLFRKNEFYRKIMIMRITDVGSTRAIKMRVEMPSPDQGWWSCTTECYKMAKDACGSSAQCDFLCDLADLAGGCTISMAAACTIYCI